MIVLGHVEGVFDVLILSHARCVSMIRSELVMRNCQSKAFHVMVGFASLLMRSSAQRSC